MTKLNQRIISKIYSYETKRILFYILLRILLFIFFFLSVFFVGSIINSLIIEQESFDFLTILTQDVEVIRKFLIDDLSVFFVEIPKTLIIIFIVILVLLLLLIYGMIKNYRKNKNKIKSIISFRKKKI